MPADGAPPILSPDGTRLVWRAQDAGGGTQLFTRTLDQEQITPLAGTDGAQGPFFSADGQSVAFFAGSKLKRLSLHGGAPSDVCDAAADRGGSWGDDGYIVAALTVGPLPRIPADGGPPQTITELKQEATHRWPQVLPGAESVIFTTSAIVGDFENGTVGIQSLKTGQRKTLVRGRSP